MRIPYLITTKQTFMNMKKINRKISVLLILLFTGMSMLLTSCLKDSDGSPDVKPGTPVFESITPTEAAGGEMITLKGTGLGDMQSIVFEKLSVSAFLMSTLNTEKAIIFRVPTDAEGGPQNIIFTNSEGKTLTVPFNVLAYPQVTAASNYDFEEGTQITLTGTNLNDVTKVVLTGTTDEATIVSQTKKQMVIEMPATTVTRATLDVTNVTGTTTTSIEFVSITNNFIIYADAFGPGVLNSGIQNWGWSSSASETADEAKTGTKSVKVAYSGWGAMSLFLGGDWGLNTFFTEYYSPVYLTFWAKGSGTDATVEVGVDNPSNTGTYGGSTTITVKADVWTYYKIPASTFTGTWGRLYFKLGEDATKTVYFDDILFVQ